MNDLTLAAQLRTLFLERSFIADKLIEANSTYNTKIRTLQYFFIPAEVMQAELEVCQYWQREYTWINEQITGVTQAIIDSSTPSPKVTSDLQYLDRQMKCLNTD